MYTTHMFNYTKYTYSVYTNTHTHNTHTKHTKTCFLATHTIGVYNYLAKHCCTLECDSLHMFELSRSRQ